MVFVFLLLAAKLKRFKTPCKWKILITLKINQNTEAIKWFETDNKLDTKRIPNKRGVAGLNPFDKVKVSS